MTDREQSRDAVSGEYVTEKYAKENPDTTVTEHAVVASAARHDPLVGKIVHYVSYGTPGGEYTSECRAAILSGMTTAEDGSTVADLVVLNPTGMFFNQKCKYSGTERTGGTWHWVS